MKRLGSVSGASRDGTQTFPRARSSSLTPCVSASISSCGKAEAGLGRGRVRQRQGESASGRGLPAPRNFTSTDWQEPRGTRGACPKVCGAGAVGCWRRLQDLEQRRVIVVRVEVRRHVHAEEARVVVAGAKGLHLLRDLRQGGAGRGAGTRERRREHTGERVCVCVWGVGGARAPSERWRGCGRDLRLSMASTIAANLGRPRLLSRAPCTCRGRAPLARSRTACSTTSCRRCPAATGTASA